MMLKKDARHDKAQLVNVSLAHTYLSKKNLLQNSSQITDETFNIIMKATPLGGFALTKTDVYHLTRQIKKHKKMHFVQKLAEMFGTYDHRDNKKRNVHQIKKSAKKLVNDKEK